MDDSDDSLFADDDSDDSDDSERAATTRRLAVVPPPPPGARIEVCVGPGSRWKTATVLRRRLNPTTPPSSSSSSTGAPSSPPFVAPPREREDVVVADGPERGLTGELVCVDGTDAVVRPDDGRGGECKTAERAHLVPRRWFLATLAYDDEERELDMETFDTRELVLGEEDQKYLDSLSELERDVNLPERYEKLKNSAESKRKERECGDGSGGIVSVEFGIHGGTLREVGTKEEEQGGIVPAMPYRCLLPPPSDGDASFAAAAGRRRIVPPSFAATTRDLFGDSDDSSSASDDDDGAAEATTAATPPRKRRRLESSSSGTPPAETDPRNDDDDDGARAFLGPMGGSERVFCGTRWWPNGVRGGRLPRTYCFCGPAFERSAQQQCPSCRRFEVVRRSDALRRLARIFCGDGDGDSSAADEVAVAALRKWGGSYSEAAGRLRKSLDSSQGEKALESVVSDLRGSHGTFLSLAAPPSSAAKAADDVGPGKMANDGENENEPKRVSADAGLPETLISDGHRMILIPTDGGGIGDDIGEDNGEATASAATGEAPETPRRQQGTHRPVRCVLCSCPVPHALAGNYRCSSCGLCEGCVATRTVLRCPGLANGTAHHHHPLTFAGCDEASPATGASGMPRTTRASSSCHFEQVGDGCLVRSVAWRCESCDFGVCAACVGRPPPENYRRLPGEGGDDDDDDKLGASSPNAPPPAAAENDAGNAARRESGNLFASDSDDDDDDEVVDRDDEDSDDEYNGEFIGNRASLDFDDRAARRDVASRWERRVRRSSATRSDGASSSRVLVGSGVVGDAVPDRPGRSFVSETFSSDYDSDGPPGDADRPPRRRRTTARRTPDDARLSSEATRALERFRAGGGDRESGSAGRSRDNDVAAAARGEGATMASGGREETGAGEGSTATTAEEAPPGAIEAPATDVDHVESILCLAESVDDRLTRRALCDAIAAGRLGIAGAILTSRSFAPSVSAGDASREGIDAAGEEEAAAPTTTVGGTERTCWCGDPIDAQTAPDGAVGCLGGHAMHAPCAADLLLGGGLCPTCRQPLFFSRVGEREAREAARLHAEEAERDRREKERRLRQVQEEEGLAEGDVVKIRADIDACRRTQTEGDPSAGGWNEDMSEACGLEGRVVEVVREGAHASPAPVIAARVRLLRTDHCLTPGWGRSTCPACRRSGHASQRGWHQCWRCHRCESCCRRNDGECTECTNSQCGWVWNSSLLTLVRRSRNEVLEDAAKRAEQHMGRLRAELRAIKAAREAVKAEMMALRSELAEASSTLSSALRTNSGSPWTRELSTRSSAAIGALSGRVSPAQWQRARHLLLLARQWGDSDQARAKRATLYGAVREGELDTVARIVRRHNAARAADEARWTDAMSATREYVVDPSVRVDLRSFPHSAAPRTGYVLQPKTHFRSKQEILDEDGSLWILVAEVMGNKKRIDTTNAKALQGARVQRGEGWNDGNSDGGAGNEGVIVSVEGSEIIVQWSANDDVSSYKIGRSGPQALALVDPQPPPQGWMCVRPSGIPAIVANAKSPFKCLGCGDEIVPQKPERPAIATVEGKEKEVKKGDRLLVAATLEPVYVQSVVESSILSVTETRIFCTFAPEHNGGVGARTEGENGKVALVGASCDTTSMRTNGTAAPLQSFTPTELVEVGSNSPNCKNNIKIVRNNVRDLVVWYRPCDLIFPKGKREYGLMDGDERRLVRGQMHSRHELFLMANRNEATARKLWNEADPRQTKGKEPDVQHKKHASCARGHLLHARCLQSALLAGRCCPAPGCTEPLWVPRAERMGTSETSCGMADRDAEAETEALKAASELPGHAAAVAARGSEGAERSADPVAEAGIQGLKMCPLCCSGPLFNENCSDMETHHGECTSALLGQGRRDVEQCTPDGTFKASAKDIAVRMAELSSGKSVPDVLPRCPKHNVLVMFNGCLNCGHLFTDTPWNDMPSWDPNAKSLLDLDVKKRQAARLLAGQVRKEAALLQFERDSLWEAKSTSLISCKKLCSK